FAAAGDNPDIVNLLLDKGAKMDARSGEDNGTALYLAAGWGKKRAAEALLNRGADVNQIGKTEKSGRDYTPLMGAVSCDHPELVELFLARGARIEQSNSLGETALLVASSFPCASAFKLLLEKGANVAARDPDGHTALLRAVHQGRPENVKLLLSHGADPNEIPLHVDYRQSNFDPYLQSAIRD